MLESKDLGGKCADLNALYVGLARAAGLPARDVYGIRIAKSELGYKSLGASSENITKAQHCRAEVYIGSYGWVPVDPADVRKVVLEEPPGNRPLDDEMVKKARARLFGSWEMNWMAYNFAHDVALPGSTGAPVGFLMYPQAETSDGRHRQPRSGQLQVRNHVERDFVRCRIKNAAYISIDFMRLIAFLFVASLACAQDRAAIERFTTSNQQRILSEFIELLSIPNVATDRPNIRRNAEFIRAMLERRGMKTELLETAGNPLVYGEKNRPGADENHPLLHPLRRAAGRPREMEAGQPI